MEDLEILREADSSRLWSLLKQEVIKGISAELGWLSKGATKDNRPLPSEVMYESRGTIRALEWVKDLPERMIETIKAEKAEKERVKEEEDAATR